MIFKSSIEKLMRREHLPGNVCQQIVDEILTTQENSLQIAAFLALLRAKKETAEELTAFVKALRAKMIRVPVAFPVLDIVGTGGDGLGTVNISTGSALLAASCGVKIAKHGNRAVSSQAGSADVLEALGVNIQLSPEHVGQCIEEVGIGFCYSPNFHPVTQNLQALRKQLNIPTTFNILGPLLNPAYANHMLLGVFDQTYLPIMADVLNALGCKRSVIVHGSGLDELSCVGRAHIFEINENATTEYEFDPDHFGFVRCSIRDLQGGDAKKNADLLLAAFHGKQGPIAETLILNAAFALYLYGIHSSLHDAILHAKDHLYRGSVLKLLKNWIEISHE